MNTHEQGWYVHVPQDVITNYIKQGGKGKYLNQNIKEDNTKTL